jgi:hypothetical protein
MMHCFNNVITDVINSCRPTNGGEKYLYKHENRTTKRNVKEACAEEGIHLDYLAAGPDLTMPPWIFSKENCKQADKSMELIIGSSTFEERPRCVFKAGKAANSHDTIYWAATYARWCMRNKGSAVYRENICGIFDIMAALNSARLNKKEVRDTLRPRLIKLLIERAGLLPPTESMLTLHELLHVVDQVEEVGVPRVNTLFKFERMNHILKQLLKNNAKGIFVSS